MKETVERNKFTTNLDKNTLTQLEEIKLSYNKLGNNIKGLNKIIEIIVDEKWRGMFNNDNNK